MSSALMAAKTFAMAAVSSAAQAKFISPNEAKTSVASGLANVWEKIGELQK